MGCCNSHNSVHPTSQPIGEANPCFNGRSGVLEMQEVMPNAPNTSPELPRRSSGGNEMKAVVNSELDHLSSWIENNKKGIYRPKLVRHSIPSGNGDDGYATSLEAWRNKFSVPPQNLDKHFESVLEAELEPEERPNIFFKHKGFPQKPVETQSQRDFFEMLDKKISEGPDYIPKKTDA